MLTVELYRVVLWRAINTIPIHLNNTAYPAVEQVRDAVGVDDGAIAFEAVHHAGGVDRTLHRLDYICPIKKIPLVDDELDTSVRRSPIDQVSDVAVVGLKLTRPAHHRGARIGCTGVLRC